jgi:hypothetical protein
MKMIPIKRIVQTLTVTVGLLLSAQTQAGFVFGYDSAFINQGGNFILGNNFVVNSPVTVNQLGVFDQDAPPTGSTSIPIAIYEQVGSSWDLVTGTAQTISSSGGLVDATAQTRYINISPVTLGMGTYSVVTATSSDYNSGNPDLGSSVVTFNNTGQPLSLGAYDIWNYYGGGGLNSTLTGMYTTGPGNSSWPWPLPVFGAGTFSVVPEPTTMIAGALLLLPFGASTLRILRRKQTA